MPQEGRGIQNPRGIPLGATEGPNVPCPRIAVPHHSVFPRTPGLYPRGVKTRFQIPPSKPAFFFTTFFQIFSQPFFFSKFGLAFDHIRFAKDPLPGCNGCGLWWRVLCYTDVAVWDIPRRLLL
jgi:hypothetical protein